MKKSYLPSTKWSSMGDVKRGAGRDKEEPEAESELAAWEAARENGENRTD
jgi:hypothetical protein